MIDEKEMEPTTELYRPEMTSLINAENGSVFLDTEKPRVCIRGAEGLHGGGHRVDAGIAGTGWTWV